MAGVTLKRHTLPRCYVVGTSFEGRDRIILKHCYEGMKVRLQREPSNPHDPNAVSVWVAVRGFFSTRSKMIGHIKRSHAKILSKEIDKGKVLVAIIDEIYIPENQAASPSVKLFVDYA